MNAKAYYELLERVAALDTAMESALLRIATLERLLANATRSTGKKEAA